MDDLNLDIDPLKLDEEWMGQPRLFHRFAMAAADADAAVDQAKMYLKVVEGELEMSIRADPVAYGLIKGTEGEVKAAIPAQQPWKTASKKYIEARRDAAYAAAAVQAIETRKRALENLVDLLKMDYHAAPRASRETTDEMQEAQKRMISSRVRRPRGIDESS